MTNNYRLFTGIRPTGPVHLGHYFGVLQDWLRLQSRFQCFLCIADLHSLNTPTEDHENIVLNILRGCLATGLDLNRTTIFLQSKIPEHAELCTILGTFVNTVLLGKNPTFRNNNNPTLGLLSYPVLMLADILLYNAHFVHVGRDQVPHIEITRSIVRKLRDILVEDEGQQIVEPTYILSDNNCLAGPGGFKMAKSNSNTINLWETESGVNYKVKAMTADGCKTREETVGNPGCCSVRLLHKTGSNVDLTSDVIKRCRTGKLGCSSCKKLLVNSLLRNQWDLLPVGSDKWCHEILASVADVHCTRMRVRASRVISNIRNSLRISYNS